MLQRAAARLLPQQGQALLLLRQGAAGLQGRSFATVDSSGTHDDFKTVYKAPATPPVDAEAQIKQDVQGHDVFVYMKGSPDAPQCGFSNTACRALEHYGVRFGSRNVLADQAIREAIKKYTSWPTIPQVFVKGEFVGGADILISMHESGELETLLKPIREQQAHK